MKLIKRIRRKLMKLRLQPIRVFCLHHITTAFDETSMCDGDWMQIDDFKQSVEQLQHGGYAFVSLEVAYQKISHDIFRFRKYAVLTADDGYKSLDEILPWLIEQRIPITLFINGKYTDGKSQRQVEGKHFTYLTTNDLQNYIEKSNGLISIQSHGWEHLDATKVSLEDFHQLIDPYHKFHAYTWGHHTTQTDNLLRSYHIIPVLIDGMKNYNDASCIHRELLEKYDKDTSNF